MGSHSILHFQQVCGNKILLCNWAYKTPAETGFDQQQWEKVIITVRDDKGAIKLEVRRETAERLTIINLDESVFPDNKCATDIL